jgi:hypothetical protein
LVTGGFGDGFERLNKNVLSELAAIWRRLGGIPMPGASVAKPGTGAHLAGTFPMG